MTERRGVSLRDRETDDCYASKALPPPPDGWRLTDVLLMHLSPYPGLATLGHRKHIQGKGLLSNTQ